MKKQERTTSVCFGLNKVKSISLFLLHLWSNCVFLYWTNNKSNCYFFWIWASHSQVNCRLIKAMDENLPCSSYIYPLRMWCLTEPLSGGLMFLFLEIKLLQFNSNTKLFFLKWRFLQNYNFKFLLWCCVAPLHFW